MRGRRFWCKVAAHGSDVRVFVTKSQPEIDGHLCDAYYDSEDNTITVGWQADESAVKMKLLHELLHVCFKAHSGDIRAKVLGGSTVEARNTREEMVVSFLEPVLFDILTRNGFLRLPKPPRPV